MKISIITVSYNSQSTILDTIDSVNHQDYPNIEHVFIDGKSTDNTLDIIKSKSKRKNVIISEKDNGIYDAMNKGIKYCTGDIIGILNSDDLYCSNLVIGQIVKAFDKSGKDIVYGNINYVDKENTNKVIRKWKSSNYITNSFKKGWHPPHPSFFVKKEVYEKYGNFDLNLKIAADFDLMYRFIEVKRAPSFFLDIFIVNMRLGGESNRSLQNIYKGNMDVIKSFKKYNSKQHPLYIFYRLIPKLKQFLR